MQPLSLYFHWPYCLSKCPYCDFNSFEASEFDTERWRISYNAAIQHHAANLKKQYITSIFFGGGTPSLMPPALIEGIISCVHKAWPVSPSVEITLEANPTSVEAEKLKGFRSAGVNRLSIGVQSLDNKALAFLGRRHSAEEAKSVLKLAAKLFDRFSFDLIYARPEQTLKTWITELKEALDYTKGHMSLYQLSIEPQTRFYTDFKKGIFHMPDQDLSAEFYETTQDIMSRYGLPAYEISNYASPGEESRHNMTYWRGGAYCGIGPGAHGRLYMNGAWAALSDHKVPEIWHQLVSEHGNGVNRHSFLTGHERFEEIVMMGLRLTEGVNKKRLEKETPDALSLDQLYKNARVLENEGYVLLDNRVLKVTETGRLVLNSILNFLLNRSVTAHGHHSEAQKAFA